MRTSIICVTRQCYYGDEIKVDGMGRAFGMHAREVKCTPYLV